VPIVERAKNDGTAQKNAFGGYNDYAETTRRIYLKNLPPFEVQI
jgi:hypothetical protein